MNRTISAPAYGKLPLAFEPNQGQAGPEVKFLSHASGYTALLTQSGVILTFSTSIGERQPASPRARSAASGGFLTPFENHSKREKNFTALRMTLVGANDGAELVGSEELLGKSNYFIGNDPKQWRTNIPHYAAVGYRNIYPGIDLVFYGKSGQLEYDFVAAPGADPGRITLEVETVDLVEWESGRVGESEWERGRVGERESASKHSRQATTPNGQNRHLAPTPRIDSNGDLVLQTAAGEIRQKRPNIYQVISGVRFPVPGRYVLKSSVIGHQSSVSNRQEATITHSISNPQSTIRNPQWAHSAFEEIRNPKSAVRNFTVALEVASYNHDKPLIIDPALSYSTYLGGNGTDIGYGIAVDDAGNAYVTGSTNSIDFPVANPLQNRRSGDDVFVTKLNAGGTAVVYSTFLGGDANDDALGIAVDSAGNAYITGVTQSLNFPTTPGAFQTSFGGATDGFIAKLSASGAALAYSTFLHGSNSQDAEQGNAIAVDSGENVYVTGFTNSNTFPTTQSALQRNSAGSNDAFISKINSTGTALVYSTYLGGSGDDRGFGIAVDSAGNACLIGGTRSANFPMQNPFQNTYAGLADAFVAKVNSNGSALIYSTYLGGGGQEAGFGIAVDSAGNAYATGTTQSIDFPVTAGAWQTRLGGAAPFGPGDAFVTRFSAEGIVRYSTYLGGSSGENPNDIGIGIGVDSSGSAYVTGETHSTDFPAINSLQSTLGGLSDAFVTKLNPAGSALLYSTYLGGSSSDQGRAIAVDSAGNAYVTGVTLSFDFPTFNPWQPANSGFPSDVFVTKIAASETLCTLTCSAVVPATARVGSAALFSATALSNCAGAAVYQWNFGDGALAVDPNPLHSYSASGIYTWILTVNMSGLPPCTKSGTILVVAPSRRRP